MKYKYEIKIENTGIKCDSCGEMLTGSDCNKNVHTFSMCKELPCIELCDLCANNEYFLIQKKFYKCLNRPTK